MGYLDRISIKKVLVVTVILFTVSYISMWMCDLFNANRWVGVPDADGDKTIGEIWSQCYWYGKIVFSIGFVWFFCTVLSFVSLIWVLIVRFVDKIIPDIED